ncbi:hypothetical protein Nepgr_009334 [Nepenthes gracilis]|uniref:Receptor-like serine/threonine-protein kinase n=1 Tax=Nepenthes gracilis TaxID=150966 RepID=A0AAD3SBA3_NEPGR|nr:hypothetical protein Nepgr_009334 [Nepenthes gracilis]
MRHFVGKGRRAHFSRGLGSVIAVYLLLGFSFFGFCDDLPMLSVPLGFGISGFDLRRNWVSQNGLFAFGFFEGCLRDPDYDDGLVVGIRYNLGTKEANVPVWTVGGGVRVSVNSTFGLSADGRLVLCENPSSLIVWSSNTSNLGVQKASLLDNGNLVLFGVEDEILWQSFDSPTSTLLPGQSFRFPQSLRAPSTKSISSYYNFVIHCSGELALVWESNVTYWRSHWSSTANIKEARFDSTGVLGLFDGTNRSVWSVSSKDSEDPSIVVRHLRIDPDGNLRIYSWDSVLLLWKIGWQAVENQCNVFGSCGLYSLCGFNSTGPVCSCLYEESLSHWTSPLRMDAGVSGCKKLVDLANCKMRTGMMVLKHSVLYGLYPPHDVDIMLNEEDCRQYCLNETSCIAVTSKNDGSGLCTIKRTSFISGYGNPAVPAISFLKVCLVPQAVSAQKTNPHTLSSRRLIVHASSSDFVRALALIGLTTAMGCLVVQMSVFWIIYQGRKTRVRRRIPFEKYDQMNRDYSALIQLNFEEIKQLTTNFTSQLGPSIFKSILPNKTPIIAKVLNNVAVSEKDFRVAVSIFGGTHHRNLVALKGFCYDQKHKILLFEYISAGSLDKWLFSEEHTRKHEEEFWQQRLNIALGVARALAYLHSECQNCVPHGNLKLENVMLNEMLVPKVMDFGLNNLISREATTSSESASDRDIYKFGEMLIQIVTCKKDTTDMKHHLVEDIREQKLESQEQERVVKIALWCMQNQPFLRPSIGEIVKVLEGTLPVDNPPSNFAFGVDNQIDGEDQKEIEVDFGVGS